MRNQALLRARELSLESVIDRRLPRGLRIPPPQPHQRAWGLHDIPEPRPPASRPLPDNLVSGTYGQWATTGETEESCPICLDDVSVLLFLYGFFLFWFCFLVLNY